MVDIYRNLANHMPDNGMQIVIFIIKMLVYGRICLILWSSGLRVTAAWTIATETDASGLRMVIM